MTDLHPAPTQADFVRAAEILDNLDDLVVKEVRRRGVSVRDVHVATGVSVAVILDCYDDVKPTGESARHLMLWLGGVV